MSLIPQAQNVFRFALGTGICIFHWDRAKRFQIPALGYGESVVDEGNQMVGLPPDNGGRTQRFDRPIPFLPQSGKSQAAAIPEPDWEGVLDFALAPTFFFPLIKSVRYNQAASALDRISKTGFFIQDFASSVDQFGADEFVFGPKWNEAPLVTFERTLSIAMGVESHDLNLLGRRDVEAKGRFEKRLLDSETLNNIEEFMVEGKAAAHDLILQQMRCRIKWLGRIESLVSRATQGTDRSHLNCQ